MRRAVISKVTDVVLDEITAWQRTRSGEADLKFVEAA
jgi:hypothetical protein